MQIFIESIATGKLITLDVKGSDCIYSIKSAIHVKENIPLEQLYLSFTGIPLMDGCTLSDYNIVQGSKLLWLRASADDMEPCCSERGNEPMQIYVKTLTSGKIKLDVHPNTTIGYVKVLLAEKAGTHPDQQRLTFSGEHLEECYTLSDYNIRNESTLNLES